MKWVLLLIIVLMAGGGYFEYNVLQNQASTNRDQIADLKAKLQKATADSSGMADAIAKLKSSLADAQAKEDSLTQDLKTAQAAEAAALAKVPPPPPSFSPAGSTSPAAPTGPFITKLGTITTLGGKVYTNCQLLKIQTDSIVISNADGITQIQFALLPADLQRVFGFDPKLGALTDDQVQVLEQKRQAAFAAGR